MTSLIYLAEKRENPATIISHGSFCNNALTYITFVLIINISFGAYICEGCLHNFLICADLNIMIKYSQLPETQAT